MGSVVMNDEQPKFGHAMKQHFLFDPKYVNLNHGSFGTYPLPVRNALRGYQKLAESAPDKFIRYQVPDLLKNSRTAIARLLNVAPEDCVFVQNATSGINTILRNLVYEPNDVIIYFDTIYGALEKTLASLLETTPNLQIRKVGYGQDFAYSLPCTHPEILNAFSQTISRLIYDGLKPKVAVFDTIVSLPGVRFPFERLTRMCKEYGILSVIDGAHGVGQISLNLNTLDADFFVSNCHKWLYTPRGCAILHVPPRNQPLIRTTYPTSHGFVPDVSLPSTNQHFPKIRNVLSATHGDISSFQTLFAFVATTDNSPYFCVPAALNFRNNLLGGEEEIYRYIRDVTQRGADLLAMILGTEVMDDLDSGEGLKAMGSVEGHVVGRIGEGSQRWQGGLRDCAMANILLPLTIIGGSNDASPQGRGSLRSGPGGGGSAGGLSPFGPMRRSPSPSPSPGGLGSRHSPTGGLTPTMNSRSPSLGVWAPGHSYSKSSAAALPSAPSRSPSLPLLTSSSPTQSMFPRSMSPHSPFAPHRRSSGPLSVTIKQEDVQMHIAWMERTLVEEFNTFLPVYEYKGRMWCRVSGQVYLEVRDFEWIGGVLRGLCERVGDGESLNVGGEPVEEVVEERMVPMTAEQGEVERLRGRLGALDTTVNGRLGSGAGAGSASASGVRKFDVRIGRWVDG